MKKITFLLFFITSVCFSQTEKETLQFSTEYYDAVDKWVAFPSNKNDNIYYYGYIYIDEMAGFTFDLGNSFKITEQNKYVAKNQDEHGRTIYRIESKWRPIAIISDKKVEEMGLPKRPKHMEAYYSNAGTVEYQKNIGYFYNHVGASHQALEPLEEAYQKDPHYDGLEFELAFAYNALKEYQKAIPILEKAIENNPKNILFYKELGYAYRLLGKTKKAEETYLQAFKISNNNALNAEMALNMTLSYFEMKDKKNFEKWASTTKKYATENDKFSQYIDYLKSNWGKK
jgi:tetratricopeptide (TPR) repeat protein